MVLEIRDPELIGRSFGGRNVSSVSFRSLGPSLCKGVRDPPDKKNAHTLGKREVLFARKHEKLTKDVKNPFFSPLHV